MQRLERSKLFVIEYSFESRWPTFILADNMYDALSGHQALFPSYHRSLKSITFLSANPLLTNTIAERDLIAASQPTPPVVEEADDIQRE